MALPKLDMDVVPVGRALPSTRSATPVTVNTAADIAQKPRLVGVSTIDEVERIAPGMGENVRRNGVKSVVALVKQNPKKAAAIATVTALGSIEGYDQLRALAESHPIDRIREFFSNVQDGVDAIESQAGLNTLTPNEDGVIADFDSNDVAMKYALVAQAKEKLKNAAAAVGGLGRLIALEEWRAIDDDLKAIVLADAN